MKRYFHNLFVSQKYLANVPPYDPPPDVPGGDTGGGGPGAPVPPPTFTPGFIAYTNPRYRLNVVINESMAVQDCMNDVICPVARMFISQGSNGQVRLHNKKPVTWALSTLAAAKGATTITVDDIRNWITDRRGYLLVDAYTTESEVRIVSDANYTTAQNSVTLTASANITVSGFAGADGNNTPATATLTITSTASGTPSNVTLDGVSIDFTAGGSDTTDGLAGFLVGEINKHPYMTRRFVATSAANVITIKGKFGDLVVSSPFSKTHVAPLVNPTVAPTIAAAAGSTSSQAGVYRVAYSYVNARGQTYRSPSSSVTLTAGQKIDVTGVVIPAGAIAVNWYVTPTAGSERLRSNAAYHQRTDSSNFSITMFPLLTATQPPEFNRTGCEVMRVRMPFSDRPEVRTTRTSSNVLRATYEWLLGTRKKSVNVIKLPYRDNADDWRQVTLLFKDPVNIAKVKKEESEEVNGQGIHNTFQALRIVSSKLGEFRDADFYYQWSTPAREAGLLEEGDVVAITDSGSGVVNLPVMIEEININPHKAGLPTISFTAQKFSNFLYDDSLAERVTPIVTEFD